MWLVKFCLLYLLLNVTCGKESVHQVRDSLKWLDNYFKSNNGTAKFSPEGKEHMRVLKSALHMLRHFIPANNNNGQVENDMAGTSVIPPGNEISDITSGERAAVEVTMAPRDESVRKNPTDQSFPSQSKTLREGSDLGSVEETDRSKPLGVSGLVGADQKNPGAPHVGSTKASDGRNEQSPPYYQTPLGQEPSNDKQDVYTRQLKVFEQLVERANQVRAEQNRQNALKQEQRNQQQKSEVTSQGAPNGPYKNNPEGNQFSQQERPNFPGAYAANNPQEKASQSHGSSRSQHRPPHETPLIQGPNLEVNIADELADIINTAQQGKDYPNRKPASRQVTYGRQETQGGGSRSVGVPAVRPHPQGYYGRQTGPQRGQQYQTRSKDNQVQNNNPPQVANRESAHVQNQYRGTSGSSSQSGSRSGSSFSGRRGYQGSKPDESQYANHRNAPDAKPTSGYEKYHSGVGNNDRRVQTPHQPFNESPRLRYHQTRSQPLIPDKKVPFTNRHSPEEKHVSYRHEGRETVPEQPEYTERALNTGETRYHGNYDARRSGENHDSSTSYRTHKNAPKMEPTGYRTAQSYRPLRQEPAYGPTRQEQRFPKKLTNGRRHTMPYYQETVKDYTGHNVDFSPYLPERSLVWDQHDKSESTGIYPRPRKSESTEGRPGYEGDAFYNRGLLKEAPRGFRPSPNDPFYGDRPYPFLNRMSGYPTGPDSPSKVFPEVGYPSGEGKPSNGRQGHIRGYRRRGRAYGGEDSWESPGSHRYGNPTKSRYSDKVSGPFAQNQDEAKSNPRAPQVDTSNNMHYSVGSSRPSRPQKGAGTFGRNNNEGDYGQQTGMTSGSQFKPGTDVHQKETALYRHQGRPSKIDATYPQTYNARAERENVRRHDARRGGVSSFYPTDTPTTASLLVTPPENYPRTTAETRTGDADARYNTYFDFFNFKTTEQPPRHSKDSPTKASQNAIQYVRELIPWPKEEKYQRQPSNLIKIFGAKSGKPNHVSYPKMTYDVSGGVCKRDVTTEGICQHHTMGFYGHPNPRCYIKCDVNKATYIHSCPDGEVWSGDMGNFQNNMCKPQK